MVTLPEVIYFAPGFLIGSGSGSGFGTGLSSPNIVSASCMYMITDDPSPPDVGPPHFPPYLPILPISPQLFLLAPSIRILNSSFNSLCSIPHLMSLSTIPTLRLSLLDIINLTLDSNGCLANDFNSGFTPGSSNTFSMLCIIMSSLFVFRFPIFIPSLIFFL